MRDFDAKYDDFAQLGVRVMAVTSNPKELAEHSVEEWEIENIPVGYGFPVEAADAWGLFVSEALKDHEPDRFTEPGLFIVRADRTLYCSKVQSMPFARTGATEILKMLEWVVDNDYPARGEVPPTG